MKKTISVLMAAGFMVMALPGMAASVVPVSYDFGEGEDQWTYGSAGFTSASDGSLAITDQADSVRFLSTANNQTGGITQTFAGLGGGARNDFSITAQFTLTEFYSWTSVGRPASIVLFANGSTVADLNTTGLAVQIHTTNTFGEEEIRIASGIEGSVLESTTWRGDDAADDPIALRDGDVMQWEVDVSFSGENNMLVEATLSRLDGTRSRASDVERSATISFFTDSASTYIGGEFFGFGGRFRNQYTTDLDTFTVIPEPSVLALLGAGLLLALSRRRR